MSLGHDDRLFVLVFDHRTSFRRLLGVGDDPSTEERRRLEDAKRLVWEGFERAHDRLAIPSRELGVLVDEELGAEVARAATRAGVRLAMPVERAGQRVFEFEYGDEFARHIEAFEPDAAKVLVRWNPDDDPADKKLQAQRLSRLGAWLHETERRLLLELLVPASESDLARVDGDADRYDTELRPQLTLRAVREIRDLGVEPDLWQLVAPDDPADGEALAGLIRDEGRDAVHALVLGDAGDERFERRLRVAAPIDGFAGFAAGPPAWAGPVSAHLAGDIDRDEAAERIGAGFSSLLDAYLDAETT